MFRKILLASAAATSMFLSPVHGDDAIDCQVESKSVRFQYYDWNAKQWKDKQDWELWIRRAGQAWSVDCPGCSMESVVCPADVWTGQTPAYLGLDENIMKYRASCTADTYEPYEIKIDYLDTHGVTGGCHSWTDESAEDAHADKHWVSCIAALPCP